MNDSEKPTVVYVDDDNDLLESFKEWGPKDVEIICFQSAKEFLRKLKDIDPWIVISDQRMNEMDGVEVLTEVAKFHPKAQRIMLTGFSEEDLVIRCVTQANVHDYIKKDQWDTDKMHEIIEKHINLYVEKNIINNYKAIFGNSHGKD